LRSTSWWQPGAPVSERVALVTGASRGIGRAIAVDLARRGHSVAINYLTSADEAKETLALVEDQGGNGICVRADVSDSAEVGRCFSEIEMALGTVEVLVNNAGTRVDGLALSLTDDAWDRVIRTNLYGTFVCCRRALRPMLRARRGRIINITSTAGLRGSPGQVNYSAAKAGIVGLTRTLAKEVAAKGITVNAVAPGLIDTDLTSTLSDKQRGQLVSVIPQKKAGTPQDIASIVGFLCSDEAHYVTGSVFVADGGMIS
jgi:3-oxoacyl-[acyl-carrier protein] reductase